MIKKYTLDDIVGLDEKIVKLKRDVKKIADNPYPVLIVGETGTGKELFAQSIHYASNRKEKPFLAQNCAAVPSSLFESILFGTAKGGFTGAMDQAGLFEQACGGTLLLDEITMLPPFLQSKLLRVLQEHYVRRIGGSRDIPVNVRVITTTNESLEQLVDEGSFRRDLYYRLNAITLEVPPLRNRKSDIPELVKFFIEKNSKKLSSEIKGISWDALQKLMNYDYPGNVRELENIIIAAIATTDNKEVLQIEDIISNGVSIIPNNS